MLKKKDKVLSAYPSPTGEQLLRARMMFTTMHLDGAEPMSVKKVCRELKINYDVTLKASKKQKWSEDRETNVLVFEHAVTSKASEMVERTAVDAAQIRADMIAARAEFLTKARVRVYANVLEKLNASNMSVKDLMELSRFVQNEGKALEQQLISSVELYEKLHQQKTDDQEGTTDSMLQKLGITSEIMEMLGAVKPSLPQSLDSELPQPTVFASIDQAIASANEKRRVRDSGK